MADLNIVKWEWDLGNGKTTTTPSPTEIYTSGYYTITLTGTTDTGTAYSVTKEYYIKVFEDDQSLDTPDYLTKYKSLHYGWKDEHGFGWSINQRDSWVLPFTSHAIYNYDDNGVVRTIVWDGVDNKPYEINTRDTYSDSAVYTDKADVNGLNGVEIPASITFPELTSEMTHFDFTHVETNVLFRPEVLSSDFRGGFTVDFTLITDGRSEAVETQYRQDVDSEVLFYYQNGKTGGNTRSRKIKVDTTTSEFQLLNVESYFKTADRFKRVFGTLNDTQVAMSTIGAVRFWATRSKGYGYDMVSKASFDTANMTPIAGPDGKENSGINFASNQTYTLNTSATGVLLCWAKQAPDASGWAEVYTGSDGWSIWRTVRFEWPNLFFIAGDYFDIRVIDCDVADLDANTISAYATKIEQFLPRY